MLIFDLVQLGLANLWRTKLRTFLTILGVIVGVGALSSMVSFGTGMQKNITESFRKNDLFTSLRVTAKQINLEELASGNLDSLAEKLGKPEGVMLNDSMVRVINELEGVTFAFPEIQIPVQVRYRGKETSTSLKLLPARLASYYPFNEMLAGSFFKSDTDLSVVLRADLLRQLGIRPVPDGETIVSDTTDKLMPLPYSEVIGDTLDLISVVPDIRSIVSNPFRLLMGSHNLPMKDSAMKMPVCGILQSEMQFTAERFTGGALIPFETGKKIPNLGFNSVWDILGKVSQPRGYGSIYVRVDKTTDLTKVRKQLESMGMNIFSFTDELKEIKQAFLIMDSMLGAIGFIALFVAALGIINTLLMSILERTREIGIMKSIGGSEGEIRTIFFTEAVTIGLLGAIFGLILGWFVTRVANAIINARLIPEELPTVDLFYFPLWLIAGATAFSILLSLAAGLYPASRAARIDPVKALRHD
jgi:putative ABC transport system permease protein